MPLFSRNKQDDDRDTRRDPESYSGGPGLKT